ncbi:FAD-binding protein, partial [Stenotrophomonas maltophilia]
MTRVSGSSWGRDPRGQPRVVPVLDREDGLPLPDHGSVLPHGNGRSYGDRCLTPDGTLLASRALDRFIAF